jgi:Transglutaminase-like superfamily
VLEERRGICIDLALLLAACWERIGLRAVIILLKGHALPAYWRSEAAWDAFRRGELMATNDGTITAATAPWMVEQHAEVVAHVRAQALWPVEATRIAKRSGFADAVHAGMDALRLATDFDCLIDISVAREKGVLPLP